MDDASPAPTWPLWTWRTAIVAAALLVVVVAMTTSLMVGFVVASVFLVAVAQATIP
jgi:hypothetical protein